VLLPPAGTFFSLGSVFNLLIHPGPPSKRGATPFLFPFASSRPCALRGSWTLPVRDPLQPLFFVPLPLTMPCRTDGFHPLFGVVTLLTHLVRVLSEFHLFFFLTPECLPSLFMTAPTFAKTAHLSVGPRSYGFSNYFLGKIAGHLLVSFLADVCQQYFAYFFSSCHANGGTPSPYYRLSKAFVLHLQSLPRGTKAHYPLPLLNRGPLVPRAKSAATSATGTRPLCYIFPFLFKHFLRPPSKFCFLPTFSIFPLWF